MDELKAKIVELRSHTRVPINEEEEMIMRKLEASRALREGVKQRQQVFSHLSSIMSEYTLCVSFVGLQSPVFVESSHVFYL